eukprot:g8194.t1 g8194   contig28:82055-84223(-)
MMCHVRTQRRRRRSCRSDPTIPPATPTHPMVPSLPILFIALSTLCCGVISAQKLLHRHRPHVDPLQDGILLQSISVPVHDHAVDDDDASSTATQATRDKEQLLMYYFKPMLPPYTDDKLKETLLLLSDEPEEKVVVQGLIVAKELGAGTTEKTDELLPVEHGEVAKEEEEELVEAVAMNDGERSAEAEKVEDVDATEGVAGGKDVDEEEVASDAIGGGEELEAEAKVLSGEETDVWTSEVKEPEEIEQQENGEFHEDSGSIETAAIGSEGGESTTNTESSEQDVAAFDESKTTGEENAIATGNGEGTTAEITTEGMGEGDASAQSTEEPALVEKEMQDQPGEYDELVNESITESNESATENNANGSDSDENVKAAGDGSGDFDEEASGKLDIISAAEADESETAPSESMNEYGIEGSSESIGEEEEATTIEASEQTTIGNTLDDTKIKIQYDEAPPISVASNTDTNNNDVNYKDANREFVTGLDEIDKLFESVSPPDELDVGADGSSIQDVLVGQGLKIILKRAKSLGNSVKDRFERIVEKAMPQIAAMTGDGGFGGGREDEDESFDDVLSLMKGGDGLLEKEGVVDKLQKSSENDDIQTKQKVTNANANGDAKPKNEKKGGGLLKTPQANKLWKFARRKWEQAKHLFDDLFSIFEGNDMDDNDEFDLGSIKSLVGKNVEGGDGVGAHMPRFGSEVDDSFLKSRYDAMLKLKEEKRGDSAEQ